VARTSKGNPEEAVAYGAAVQGDILLELKTMQVLWNSLTFAAEDGALPQHKNIEVLNSQTILATVEDAMSWIDEFNEYGFSTSVEDEISGNSRYRQPNYIQVVCGKCGSRQG
jgi:molecular chaperone DnaK (HSP70)